MLNLSFSVKNPRQAKIPSKINFDSYHKNDLNKIESFFDSEQINIQPIVNKKIMQQPVQSQYQAEKQKDKQEMMLTSLELLSEYIDYLKGIFLLKQIIEPIEADHLLDLQKQKYLQFMVLVSQRAKIYISKFHTKFQKLSLPQFQNLNSLVDFSDVEAYKLASSSKFKAYNKNVDLFNKKIRKRIRSVSDFVYQSPQRKNKYKFMDGYEGLDYSEQEQIQFTYDKYIQGIINSQEISSSHFKNHRLKKILKSYRDICMIKGSQNKKSGLSNEPLTEVTNKRQLNIAIKQILLQK